MPLPYYEFEQIKEVLSFHLLCFYLGVCIQLDQMTFLLYNMIIFH